MPESLREALDKINKEDKKQSSGGRDDRDTREPTVYSSSSQIPDIQKAQEDRAINERMQQYQQNREQGFENEFTYEHRKALQDYEDKLKQYGQSGSDVAKKMFKPLGLGLASGNPLAAGVGAIGAGLGSLVKQIQASGKAKNEVVGDLVSQGMDPQEASDFFDQAKGYYQGTGSGSPVRDPNRDYGNRGQVQAQPGAGLVGGQIPQPQQPPQPQLGDLLSGIGGFQPQQPQQGQQMFQGFQGMQPVDFSQYNLRSALDQPGDYLSGNNRRY